MDAGLADALRTGRKAPADSLDKAHVEESDPAQTAEAVPSVEADGRYRAMSSAMAPAPVDLFPQLRSLASSGASVLAGFDFPIGLPKRYAEICGISSYRSLLPLLGTGRWERFFESARVRTDLCLERPFYPCGPVRKGEVLKCGPVWHARIESGRPG